MTPTATQLKFRLDQRLRWFENEWFFKWHHIGGERIVEIDTFDGRMARYAGIKFSGSARQIYWDAITRGVRKEIIEQFAWIEERARSYDRGTAEQTIDESAQLLVDFVQSVRDRAVQKDKVLRGDGLNFPAEQDLGHWTGAAPGNVTSQAHELKAALFPTLAQHSSNRNSQEHTEQLSYQVALSFAGEQRAYVEMVAEALKSYGINVFYDQFEIVNLWGKDGIEFFNKIFGEDAQYVVMFISADYVTKTWTRLERRAALVRAMAENREYVLPVGFDDSAVPGLPDSVQYVKAEDYTPEALAQLVLTKIRGIPAPAGPHSPDVLDPPGPSAPSKSPGPC